MSDDLADELLSEEDKNVGGQLLVNNAWELLADEVRLQKGESVVVYDVSSGHAAPSCAEEAKKRVGDTGKVEIITPERELCHNMGALNWPVFLR